MDGILIPIAGVVAALGVALLLATGTTAPRVAGAVLAGLGGIPLVLSRTSQADTLLDRPALLGVGVVAGVASCFSIRPSRSPIRRSAPATSTDSAPRASSTRASWDTQTG